MPLNGTATFNPKQQTFEDRLKKLRENPNLTQQIIEKEKAKEDQTNRPLFTKRTESTVVYTDDNDFHVEAYRQEQAKQQGSYALNKYLSKR